MCKLVAGLQATSIFVSAISITAIALDRYQVIVNPTRQACHPLKTIITLTCIWVLALMLASPLFYYRTVESISLESLSKCHVQSVLLSRASPLILVIRPPDSMSLSCLQSAARQQKQLSQRPDHGFHMLTETSSSGRQARKLFPLELGHERIRKRVTHVKGYEFSGGSRDARFTCVSMWMTAAKKRVQRK